MPKSDYVYVPALCSFEHKGRFYVTGEMCDVTVLDAALLARKGKVSLTKQPSKRGFYMRRDLRAEQ